MPGIIEWLKARLGINEMAPRRAAFLFGSGISFASKAPTVKQLTNAVFDQNWTFGTDERFHPAVTDDAETKWAKEFLDILKGPVEKHLKAREGRDAHYEDLCSAAIQIVQDETGDVTNPLIGEGVATIKTNSSHLHKGFSGSYANQPFASLAHRVANLIQWTVYHEPAKVRTPKGLHVVSELVRRADDASIFTLNHDRLLEAQFEGDSVEYCDGFGESSGDVTFFDWSWKKCGGNVRLYKLHGSINWLLFRVDAWDRYGKICEGQDMDHCNDKDGKLLSLTEFSPTFLTGTVVKEQAYGVSLIGELFSELRTRMKQHQTLICSGYGWSDNGINLRLEQWVRDAEANRLVILHGGEPDELKQRKFWQFRWDSYLAKQKLEVVSKWLCDCNASELEQYFD